jgi:filamentous hemagglutinin
MTRWHRVVLVAGGAVLLAVLLANRGSWGPPHQAFVGTSQQDAPLWSSTGQMSAGENAEHHWRKHAAEFPELKSRADYIAAAHAFVSHPPPGTLTKHDRRGDTLLYNPATNTFAVRASSGAPRTMFRPDSGMRYWERQ